jgi:hypothetical protein
VGFVHGIANVDEPSSMAGMRTSFWLSSHNATTRQSLGPVEVSIAAKKAFANAET